MSHVFLSHSKKDHAFAELAKIKLAEARISTWLDHDRLGAGVDWRQSIDQAIADSFAVVLALTPASASSSYVTYEWASAMGRGKPVIPLRLEKCDMHPKLEAIQYLDFSLAGRLPWSTLVERINEVEQDELPEYDSSSLDESLDRSHIDPMIEKILKYLDQRGYQMASFSRIRRRVNEDVTDEQIATLIKTHPHLVRPVTLKGGKKGIAKL